MKILKNKYFYAFLLALGMMTSCANEEPDANVPDDGGQLSEWVIMNVKVNTSDIPSDASVKERMTSSLRSTNPEDNGEKMNSLRIIVVRPDGMVEHNKYFDLKTAPKTTFTTKMKVHKSESKKIYLIANEATLKTDGGKLVNYDFNTIAQNYAFPEADLKSLEMSTKLDTEILPSPVPMTDMHTVYAPAKDFSADLFITRSVVKFSFNIENNTGKPVSIGNLTINKIGRKSYVFPRVTKYNSFHEIVNFDVPLILNNDYYVFRKNVGQTIPAKVGSTLSSVNLRKIYLLEGKYTDSQDARNYSMSMDVNGITMSQYFPDLKQLPRNTHVVVNVTVNDAALKWVVKLIPFTGVNLNPEFGL